MTDAAVTRAKEPLQSAIARCADCHDVCIETVSQYLQRRDDRGQFLHVRMLLDCAQVCDTARDLMLRSSDFYRQICALCADVCERCAHDSERMADETMRRCAESCRRCAEACRQVAAKR